MKTLTQTILISALLSMPVAQAVVPGDMIKLYNAVGQGESSQTNELHQQLSGLNEADPQDASTLFYLGASETLKGRDAFWPWSKLKWTENGLARMDKALMMITDDDWQHQYQQMPLALQMQAQAAIVYTSVPDMFAVNERGNQLFEQVFADPRFQQIPAEATSWVYFYGIQATEDQPEQQKILFQAMTETGLQDQFTEQARSLLEQH